MTCHYIFADMTSHRRGFGVQPIIDAAARHAQTNPDTNKIIWLVPSHLTAAFSVARNIRSNDEVRHCDIMGETLWSMMDSEFKNLKSTSPSVQITAVTWDPFINGKVRDCGQGVVGVKWFDWINENRSFSLHPFRRTAEFSVPPGSQSTDSVSLVRQIEDAILSYLRSTGATNQQAAVLRSRVRPALRQVSGLWSVWKHPLFGASFKMALDKAINNKLIGEERLVPGHEKIWLTLPGATTTASTLAVPIIPQAVAVQAPQSNPKPPTFQRSAEFRQRLTILGIFCEKRERDTLLEATQLLLQISPMTLSKLRRELPKTAKQIADERNLCAQTDFRRIVNFFLKLLLVSGALTSDGGTMERNASSEATPVTGLVKNAVDVVESYMLEQILKKSDVKDLEQWQLALTLLREFDQSTSMDDKLDRVASLIAHLSDRIILTDDGTYQHTGNAASVAKTVAMRVPLTTKTH